MLKRIVMCFFVLLQAPCYAQNKDSSYYFFREKENELKTLEKKAFHSRKESERLEANKLFISHWDDMVQNPAILDYPFDSLKDISILSPKNNLFKLVTWNLHRDDGTHFYFGYLLVKTTKRIKTGFMRHKTEENYEHYKLIDRSPSIKSPENYISGCDKWFGMLYYDLIEMDGFYMLLGYDPNDKLVRRKFVDVLYFKSDGTPVFGKDVFRYPRKNPKRLMFEYSSDVVMSLRYDPSSNRIIYSHLASNQEGNLLEGQVQFYGPDGSFDALTFRKGKWVVVEDIDARNERNKNDNASKPDPKKQTPIFKPK